MSLMDMMKAGGEWLTPDRAAKMSALGQGLQGLGSGRPVNMNAAYDQLMQQERQAQAMTAMQESGVMDRFTPQQQAILAQMPPQAAQSIIAQTLFAPTPQARIEEVNGQLVNIDTGQVVGDFRSPTPAPSPTIVNGQLVNPQTGEVIGDYRTPETPDPGYRQLTPDEVAAAGLDPSRAYQVAPDGKIAPIGGTPLVQNNIGQGETAFAKRTGEILANEAAEIAAQGMSAQRAMGQLVTLDAALAESPTGFAASLTKLAGDMGIKTDGSSSIELANAIISQMVPGQRPPGSGPMSDADLELFKQSLPQLMNTQEGNKKIIETMRAIGEYDMARASIARKMQTGDLTPEQAFAEYSALSNPMADFVVPDGGGLQTATPPRPADSQLSDDEWQRAWSAMTPEQRALFGGSN